MPELKQQLHTDNTGDLRALEQLAKEHSSDIRRELMCRLADCLTDGGDACLDETVTMIGQTLVTLLDELDEPSRAELSNRVAASETTPHGLAKRLAQDASVCVAEPVLAQSPVLTDDDLVEVASAHSEGHLLAMSRRNQLSSQVTDAIIDRGTVPVFQAVASNSGAAISEAGFLRLSEEAPSCDGLAEALSRRTDIPETIAEQIIANLPPQYRVRLEELWATDNASGQALLEEAARRVGEARLSLRSGLLKAKIAAQDIISGARSLNHVINDFAGSNLPSETARVLATIAKLPERYVKAALLKRDGTAIALVCRSVHLGDKAFEEITRMRGLRLGLEASDSHQLLQAFRTLDADSAGRTVRFAAARSAVKGIDSDCITEQDTHSEDDKRKGSRVSALKKVRVHRDSDDTGTNCVARNLSADGARLEFQAETDLPDEIVLYIYTENIRVPARVVRRDGLQIGVQFSKPLDWLADHLKSV